MHIYIIIMCENYNTDNIHIVFAHMYCLLHPYVVSYIIPSFMNKISSYIQWINFFVFSNVVASFLVESYENVSGNPSSPFPD